MKIPIFQVDAFAVQPFRGNPAGVCLLDRPRDSAWMQSVASEMALPETAFLMAKGDGYELRWFTPKTEVDLCGHATLASAHILYEFGFFEQDESIKFFTLSGVIVSSFSNGTIQLDMPRRDPLPIEPDPDLISILGQYPVEVAAFEDKVLLVEFSTCESIMNFIPDWKKIANLKAPDLIITSCADDGKFDFISRFFSPRTGINEDPVTGMAHCVLGPYWAKKLNKSTLHAYQASERGGEVWVRLETNRAIIGGKAVTVMQGDLLHQKD